MTADNLIERLEIAFNSLANSRIGGPEASAGVLVDVSPKLLAVLVDPVPFRAIQIAVCGQLGEPVDDIHEFVEFLLRLRRLRSGRLEELRTSLMQGSQAAGKVSRLVRGVVMLVGVPRLSLSVAAGLRLALPATTQSADAGDGQKKPTHNEWSARQAWL